MRAPRRPLNISLGALTSYRRVLEPAREHLNGFNESAYLAFQAADPLFHGCTGRTTTRLCLSAHGTNVTHAGRRVQGQRSRDCWP